MSIPTSRIRCLSAFDKSVRGPPPALEPAFEIGACGAGVEAVLNVGDAECDLLFAFLADVVTFARVGVFEVETSASVGSRFMTVEKRMEGDGSGRSGRQLANQRLTLGIAGATFEADWAIKLCGGAMAASVTSTLGPLLWADPPTSAVLVLFRELPIVRSPGGYKPSLLSP